MKGVMIVLTTLLLALGAGTALATDGIDVVSSAAAVNHVEPVPVARANSVPLHLETSGPDFSIDVGDGNVSSEVLTVWGCDLSPQLSFGLEYRAADLKETDIDLALDTVAVKEITQNLLVALHYTF